ncbi:general odorant-binding protein 45 [Culex quinquefasciatus]|uniref:General odorant-binding protein 45 n=2 Tax=Culex pipiens TaxID=7175 RepID=A0A8D8NT83_CULPI|nr:general odorant-binding protein 45 [Culex quinquefasciatus]XP_039439895.1 general odorant-binding protein 45-like [Culex pipiens pallens]
MKLWGAFLVVALATASSAYFKPPPPPPEVEESHFAYQEKTFRRALDECAEYLEVPAETVEHLVSHRFQTSEQNLKCLIRCAGINAGWWNDTAGVQGPVIESYFQPSPDDTCFDRRTRECLEARAPLCQDDCSRAYEAFLCYYHQYGNLRWSQEYIPLPHLEAVQASIDCINILRIPRELIEQYSRAIVPNVPETQCLYRCQYLAEGLYDPQYGFNHTRFYIRHHDQPAREFLSDETRSCTEHALRDSCDECARVYRARKCFDSYSTPFFTSRIIQHAAQIILGQRGCDEDELKPRYNSIASGSYVPASHPPPPPPPSSYHVSDGGCKYNCKN